MRRLPLLFAALFTLSAAMPAISYAQMGGGGGGGGDDEEADAKREKQKKEWEQPQAPLPQLRNAGPCPYVKILYDAARYAEFKDGREASSSVGYTGEIQGVSAGCQYKGEEPIKLKMEILFELGRGPMAEGTSKTYRYWIAVTHRNNMVITRKTFDLPVKFQNGEDRVRVTEQIGEITIPRAKMTTSGSNFEVLVGFEVTPQMAEFNRDGKRFRVNAGTVATSTGAAAAKP